MLKKMFIIRQIVFVLRLMLFVLELKRVYGAGQIEIQFLSYSFNVSQELNADCCSLNSTQSGNCSINKCILSVKLCLDKAATAYGDCDLGHSTMRLSERKNAVNFNGSMSKQDTTNALFFPVQQNKGNMTLGLIIEHQDGNGTGKIFDFMQHTFLYTPGSNGSEMSFPITLQGNMSSLTIEVIMKCGRGAYGPDCGRVCVSNSESYFTCDSKGFKSCYKGWTGKDCESVIGDCSNNSCQNEAVCKDIGNSSYICECTSNYMGPFCEHLKECVVIVNQINSFSLSVSVNVGVPESFDLADLQQYLQTQQTNCSIDSVKNESGINQREVTLNCSTPVQDIQLLRKEVYDFCKTRDKRTTKSSDHESSLYYVQTANIKSTISNSLQSAYTVPSISNYDLPAYNESTVSTLVWSIFTELTTSNHVSPSLIDSGIISRLQSSFAESTTSRHVPPSLIDSGISRPIESSYGESATSIQLLSSFTDSVLRIRDSAQSSYADSTTSIHVSPSFIESDISNSMQPSYAETITSIHVSPSFTESFISNPIQTSYAESTTSSHEWPLYTDLTVLSNVQSPYTESTIISHAWPSYAESVRSPPLWSTFTAESTISSTVWSANTESAMSSFQEAISSRQIKSTKSESHKSKSIGITAFQFFDSELTKSPLHYSHQALTNTRPFWSSNIESTSLISAQTYLMQSSSPALTSSGYVLSPYPIIDHATPTLSAKHSLAVNQPIRASVSLNPISTHNPAPVTDSESPQRSAGSESAKSSILPIAGGVVGGLAAVAASAFVGVFIYKRKLKAQIHISNREEEAIADQKGSTVRKEISCEQAQENSVSEQKKVV